MVRKVSDRGPRLSYKPAFFGVGRRPGWLVYYGDGLVMQLYDLGDRGIINSGFDELPWHCVDVNWPSLAAAKREIASVARLWRAGMSPEAVTELFEAARRGVMAEKRLTAILARGQAVDAGKEIGRDRSAGRRSL